MERVRRAVGRRGRRGARVGCRAHPQAAPCLAGPGLRAGRAEPGAGAAADELRGGQQGDRAAAGRGAAGLRPRRSRGPTAADAGGFA